MDRTQTGWLEDILKVI